MLLVDKPKGWTSFDVVAKVRGMLRSGQSERLITVNGQQATARPKVGHTGTLDPLATGLLVILVGSYTKKAPEYSKLDKTYAVTMLLGQTSTTADEEGEKQAVSDRHPAFNEVEGVLQQFVGQIEQVPPKYSAIKVNGQRAYKLARRGEEPELKPRAVTVYSLELTSYDYPLVEFTATVSSGTYIRSLVEDIGRALRTGAYLAELRRTTVGSFDLAKSQAMSELTSSEAIARSLVI